jgi:hypothetical protein
MKELIDLRKTNDRTTRKAKRLADYRQRTTERRNKRRQVDLVVAGVKGGWIR